MKSKIYIIGIGPGKEEMMTGEAIWGLENSDVIIGYTVYVKLLGERFAGKEMLVTPMRQETERCRLCFEEAAKGKRVALICSGDAGIYGLASLMYEMGKEYPETELIVIPGITAANSGAAVLGAPLNHDFCVISLSDLLTPWEKIEKRLTAAAEGDFAMAIYNPSSHKRKDYLIHKLGKLLLNAGLTECTVTAGYQLSYPEQRIMELRPEECMQLQEDGLYICCIKNPDPERKTLTHGRKDGEFIRDKVPMTKEEVREVSICKLKLYEGAVVYDIGSGTGSVAAEIAGLSDEIKVFAVEYKEEAVSLIAQNKEKFGLDNIEIVSGKAPDGLEELPVPTHAFIGGSSGQMKEILSALYQKNSQMRVVINAISMETICEIKEVLSAFPIQNEDVVQIQASRAKRVGTYHLMQAENPVWICSFDFCG